MGVIISGPEARSPDRWLLQLLPQEEVIGQVSTYPNNFSQITSSQISSSWNSLPVYEVEIFQFKEVIWENKMKPHMFILPFMILFCIFNLFEERVH